MRRPAALGTAVALLLAGAGLVVAIGGGPFRGDTGDNGDTGGAGGTGTADSVGGGAVASSPAPASPGDTTQPTPDHASRGPLDPAARRYLDAVAARDARAVAAAFTPDGLVVDVGREIRGGDAIRRWAEAEVVDGDYTLLDHTPHADGTTLLVRFRPGGTGDGFRAHYRFDITDGLISRATLEYA
ncbi:nuclear transport factor 2 family protein [Streptomyces sp. NPDC001595]|uniref:nuclear transport factor 2 family protein n=1 Tax=Streptomyces sp. NPDC001532 TaxID=3154520 RepID=UPI003332FE17